MHELAEAIYLWLLTKWAQWTRYDLKGDLQMQERAAWQDLVDAWHGILNH